MIQDLVINESIKKFVRKPLGKLIKEKQLRSVFKGNVIAVGDKVSITCDKLGLNPKVAIVDYHIMRKSVSISQKSVLKNIGEIALHAKNAPGTISVEAWDKVKEAVSYVGETVRLDIEGEEDLLTLAAIFLADIGTKVIYGQPRKGIVVVDVTAEKKRELADFLIREKAREFMQKFSGKTLIVHDSDADGMTSAVMFGRYLKQKRNISALFHISDGATISPESKEQIKKLAPANLVLLDFGGEARNSIKELSQSMDVLIIDHHKMYETDFGKALYLNPHFFNVPDEYTSPTSHLSWQICRNSDWLAAAGVIADKGFLAGNKLLKLVSKKYRKVDFGKIVGLINSADAKEKSNEAVQLLLRMKNPREIFRSKFAEWEKEVSAEIKRLVSEHKQKALFLANGKVVLYEIKPKFSLRGEISNRLQQLYPGKIVIIGEVSENHYLMSFRTVKAVVSFPDIIKKATENMEGAHGGGHKKAAGCKIRLFDKERFLERFIRQIDNK